MNKYTVASTIMIIAINTLMMLMKLHSSNVTVNFFCIFTVASAFRLRSGELLSEKWYFNRRFSITVLATLLILPLLMLKKIGSLSYTRFT